jgi:hypothetical protein
LTDELVSNCEDNENELETLASHRKRFRRITSPESSGQCEPSLEQPIQQRGDGADQRDRRDRHVCDAAVDSQIHRLQAKLWQVAEKADTNFKDAVDGLDLLTGAGLEALKVPHLKGILMVHKKTPTGNKPDLQVQLRKWLDEKMANGAAEAAVLAEMKRLTAAAAAARQVNDRPLALPAPAEDQEVAPLLLHGPEA